MQHYLALVADTLLPHVSAAARAELAAVLEGWIDDGDGPGVRNPARTAVVLDTLGTARDLANAGIRLHEGCELIVYDWSDDDEDLEGHGTVHFDSVRRWWVAELDEQGVRYVPKKDRTPTKLFGCVQCRQDLSSWVESLWTRQSGIVQPPTAADRCPYCDTPLFAAIAPPVG